MKRNLALLVVGFILFAGSTGGALAKAEPRSQAECPSFDTQKVMEDLKNPFRFDRLWLETLVRRLVYQLDCEREVYQRRRP